MNETNLTLFFGHLHPLLVHLPIGFLTMLALLEVAARIHHFKGAAHARSIVLFATVLASIAAVACGLALASGGGYDDELLNWHKWMGIGLAGACILTAVSFWIGRKRFYAGFLMLTLLMLGPASHYGGSMTHGRTYLTEYAPRWVRSLAGEAEPGRPTELAVATTQAAATKPAITEAGQADLFADLVQPALASKCVGCHSADKLKGQLRLDEYELIAKGGASGPAVVAGDAAKSPLVQRLLLPESDPKHMPPAGKPQFTDDQIAVVRWWVEAGAEKSKRVGELEPPLAVADAAARVLGLPPPPPPAQPLTADELNPVVARVQAETGAVITPVAMGEPWLACNASVARSFGDAELAKLAPLARNLTSINLAGTKVTDEGLAVLASMPRLKQVRLERTAVTDAGLKSVSKLRDLETLNLYGTAVGNDGLKHLRGLPSLRYVYLWRTKVDAEGAKAFADAMVDKHKVERLKDQIALLQAELSRQTIDVRQGIAAPATMASVSSATQPTTGPATTNPSTPLLANAVCPVSGKAVKPAKFVDHEGKRIGFCCDDCLAAFKKDPAKFAGKIVLASVPAGDKADGGKAQKQ